MLLPTLSGIFSSPMKVFSAATGDTFTAQEMVDGVYGGAIIGAVAKTIRDDAVVRNTLGQPSLDRVKEARILSYI